MNFLCSIAKLPNLKLKTRPRERLGSSLCFHAPCISLVKGKHTEVEGSVPPCASLEQLLFILKILFATFTKQTTLIK
jgi:hypothetical protein